MFLATSIIFAKDIIDGLAFIDNTLSGSDSYDVSPGSVKWEIIHTILVRFNYLMGDAIVLWRAWSLYERQYAVRLLLAICFLLSFACTIADAVVTSKEFVELKDELISARIILPLALLITNSVSTFLIGYKTWRYRKTVKIFVERHNKKNKVEKILILLLESGVIYCGVWCYSLSEPHHLTLCTAKNALGCKSADSIGLFPVLAEGFLDVKFKFCNGYSENIG
ncbi:hypothetical protein VKT23_016557 [Stygiomarasmius scandens]|uniref:Uncharacterized protein n=1 Tax=Marasmiellus scandens TaxID=2682957 RepID=A0ABR1IUV4_9AGAR